MNKSPPTSGGLFYFGQIAFPATKLGTGSRYMRKVRVSAGVGIQEIKAAVTQSDAPGFTRSAVNHTEWQARADHPFRWQRQKKSYSAVSEEAVPVEGE